MGVGGFHCALIYSKDNFKVKESIIYFNLMNKNLQMFWNSVNILDSVYNTFILNIENLFLVTILKLDFFLEILVS